MSTPDPDLPYALRRFSVTCTIFYICLFSLTAASWMPKRREQLWRERLWLYYVAGLPPIFAAVRCVLLHVNPTPFSLLDVFSPLVYGPMTLVILGFTEAGSRQRKHRPTFSIAAVLILAVLLAEIGWAAHGRITCDGNEQCTANQEMGQLYFYLGWGVVDSVVTIGFVVLLVKNLASLRKAHWHLIALGTRSLAIVVLAIVGIVRRGRLVREAQVDIAMALSVCFLVVRSFRSLVFSDKTRTAVYPTHAGQHSGHKTKRSAGLPPDAHSTSSQQHINGVQERYGSEEVDADIELDLVEPAGSSKSIQRSNELR